MLILTGTEEVTCPLCRKPFTFTVSASKAQCNGCSCVPPRLPDEISSNTIITNLGGLWVLRRFKRDVHCGK